MRIFNIYTEHVLYRNKEISYSSGHTTGDPRAASGPPNQFYAARLNTFYTTRIENRYEIEFFLRYYYYAYVCFDEYLVSDWGSKENRKENLTVRNFRQEEKEKNLILRNKKLVGLYRKKTVENKIEHY